MIRIVYRWLMLWWLFTPIASALAGGKANTNMMQSVYSK